MYFMIVCISHPLTRTHTRTHTHTHSFSLSHTHTHTYTHTHTHTHSLSHTHTVKNAEKSDQRILWFLSYVNSAHPKAPLTKKSGNKNVNFQNIFFGIYSTTKKTYFKHATILNFPMGCGNGERGEKLNFNLNYNFRKNRLTTLTIVSTFIGCHLI